MEKEYTIDKIRSEFADKQFDEQTLELITNFIKEFDSLFGKYLPREEVLKRVRENLDKVTFNYEFKNQRWQGAYSLDDGAILLSKNLQDIEKIRAIFFHEMIHCLTANREKGTVGFDKTMTFQEFDEDSEKIWIGRGLDEGVTEYITRIRCQKYAPELYRNSYPILTEQTENLAELIGEDALMDMTFNAPGQLPEQLGIDEYDTDDFLEAFDSIWKEEDKIYLNQNDKDIRLFNAMFGKRDTREMNFAKSTIIKTYEQLLLSAPIATTEEFNQMYRKILKYMRQLGKQANIEMSSTLTRKIRELVHNTGKSMEELMGELDEEPRLLLQRTLIIRQFEASSNEEKIELLTNKDFHNQVFEAGEDETLPELRARLAANIIQTDSQETSTSLYRMLEAGLAQMIKDKKYNIDRLAIEAINMSEDYFSNHRSIFNLYYTDLENSAYLGTYSLNDDFDLVEFSQDIPEETKQDILREYPEFADAILLYSQKGEIVACHDNEQYTRIDEYGEENTSDGENIYCPSKLETYQKKLRTAIARCRVGMPRVLFNRPQELATLIEGILSGTSEKDLPGNSTISRQQVSRATHEITQKEIDEVRKYIAYEADIDKKRQEALKAGLSEDIRN